MGSPIAETWVHATMFITNEWHRCGTGFLVERHVDPERLKIFLATNKHVVHGDPARRRAAGYLRLGVNVRDEHGAVAGAEFTVDMQNPPGQRWREHPDPHVDVLAIDVTDMFVNNPQIAAKRAAYSVFADTPVLEEHDITIGDEVLVVGYPLGIAQGATNFPLVRQGIIASKIGETLHHRRRDGTSAILRAFLVDCGLVPGSSGSPVILKPSPARLVKGDLVLGGEAPFYLLGIVAETEVASVGEGAEEFRALAGLGLAFDAPTIRETIETFFE